VAEKTSAKSKSEATVHAFDYLAQNETRELPVLVVAIGPDDFLRRESIQHALKLGGLEPMSVTRFDGEDAQWRDVHDELSTQSLFDQGGPKAAYVRKADSFVSKNREALERWIEQAELGTTLLLDMQTLPSNQRLYKLAQSKGFLVGTAESKGAAFPAWIARWGAARHSVQLTVAQASLVADRVGYVCGMVDCELAKLGLFCDAKGKVSDARVDELVGGWRTQTVWNISSAITEGKIAEAIDGVDKLIMAGQTPVGIAAQLSWSLRRYGVAAAWIDQQKRHGVQGVTLFDALSRAGFRFEHALEEKRLKTISWNRAKDLLNWLVELEKELKGNHSQEDLARLALEKFIFRFR
jgi:DNA polymerase-3 subunit delta